MSIGESSSHWSTSGGNDGDRLKSHGEGSLIICSLVNPWIYGVGMWQVVVLSGATGE